jgi:tetratricopeptide (TPR) repeat protein/tRNA A-37 threonylcarbamoyl transferase component Bud32
MHMGIFDSLRRKKPEERPEVMKPRTTPKSHEAAAGRWQVGHTILGRYEILAIKAGGMGVVYIARDQESHRMLAIKTFQDRFLRDEDAIARFVKEAETWVNLERHTNIVFAIFVQKIEGKPCIFLEYVDGGDLSRHVGKVDVAHAIDFGVQLCSGMDYAYKQLGVIHRDIKPSNAMVTSDGVLKVTDFGLVKAVGRSALAEEPDGRAAVVSRGIGSWPYMPPEQFPEEVQRQYHFPLTEVTTRSDIYSFGVTMYEVLTGGLPFASVEQIFTQGAASLAGLNPNIPRQLELLVLKCLQRNPRDRYQSFAELTGELVALYDALPREEKAFGERYVAKGGKETLTAIDWNNKGTALAALGRPEEAIACLDRALEVNPRYAAAWNNKGDALRVLGRPEEAIACLDRALEVNPGLAEAWSNKGNALRALGRPKEAIACYDRALGVNPRYAGAWSNKGCALGEQGRPKEAIACYDRALEVNPGYADAWSNKGNALRVLARPEEAIACFDRALEVNPRYADAWSFKGNALRALGRPEEAIACYDRALEVNPRYAAAWSNKGYALRDLGRPEEAIACYDRALEVDSGYAAAWSNKGYALRDLGRPEEAIACLKKFVELAPPLCMPLMSGRLRKRFASLGGGSDKVVSERHVRGVSPKMRRGPSFRGMGFVPVLRQRQQ